MKTIAEFKVTGQLLGFIHEDGYKIKYLRINVDQKEYWIKISKEARNSLTSAITPGCILEVSGTQEIKSGKLKLKAYELKLVNSEETNLIPATLPAQKKAPSATTTVLMCQKSTCWQKGGKAVCDALTEELSDRGLAGSVKIKGTGCMKECKQGPNLVIMPDKTRYSRIRPQQIPNLVEKHFLKTGIKVEV